MSKEMSKAVDELVRKIKVHIEIVSNASMYTLSTEEVEGMIRPAILEIQREALHGFINLMINEVKPFLESDAHDG